MNKPKLNENNERQLISSGTSWEQQFGYSRAVKTHNMVYVAGTTSVDETGKIIGLNDPYQQAVFIYKKIDKALQEAGSSLKDVVRVRTFVTDIARWKEAAKAQGEVFAEIRPAATLVQVSALVEKELLVEIEVDAIIH